MKKKLSVFVVLIVMITTILGGCSTSSAVTSGVLEGVKSAGDYKNLSFDATYLAVNKVSKISENKAKESKEYFDKAADSIAQRVDLEGENFEKELAEATKKYTSLSKQAKGDDGLDTNALDYLKVIAVKKIPLKKSEKRNIKEGLQLVSESSEYSTSALAGAYRLKEFTSAGGFSSIAKFSVKTKGVTTILLVLKNIVSYLSSATSLSESENMQMNKTALLEDTTKRRENINQIINESQDLHPNEGDEDEGLPPEDTEAGGVMDKVKSFNPFGK